MPQREQLAYYAYVFDKGPLPESDLRQPPIDGNCRLALQEYFYVVHGRCFGANALLNPEAYLHTGRFVREGAAPHFFDNLPPDAVLYAEGLRNKRGEVVDKSLPAFISQEEYLIALHSAIYLPTIGDELAARIPTGMPAVLEGPAVWHATAAEGSSCIWPLEQFLETYRPVAAKDFL